MKVKLRFLSILLIVIVSFSIGLGAYIFRTYILLDENITTIEIVLNSNLNKDAVPITYAVKDESKKIDFTTPYFYKSEADSTYTASISGNSKLRQIGLYFEKPSKNLAIYSIKLKNENKIREIKLSEIKTMDRLKLKESNNGYTIDVRGQHAFIQLPKGYIYSSDFNNVYLLIIPLLILIGLALLVIKHVKPIDLKPVSIQSITIAVLILSVFLPAPLYNVALVIMAVLNVNKISWRAIKSQKVNLLILGFFLVYLLNNLFVSVESFNQMSTIERFLPLAILGIVLPSLSNRKYLALFPVSALLIGFWLLLTSIFDVFIHQNFEFLSFDYFTKYLHPVYFSYLLFFSICYVNLYYQGKSKYILEFVLFMFLIFSGSKMVFLFSLMVIFLNVLRNKKALFLIFPILIVVTLFSPLKKRFSEVLNTEDLSILKEKHIANSNDSRINGLTLRLILWREALATMSGSDFLLGKGVTKETNALLNTRLNSLGLKNHVTFNPHNQYIDTFWRTGFIGLLILISIPLYCFRKGLKNNDVLLIQFSLFFIAVMLSESVFGRVNGIFFFTTLTLILINSSRPNENRNIRHERNTQ